MVDWFQEPTVFEDRKGRKLTYPYQFSLKQHVFDGDSYYETRDLALRWCMDQIGYQSEAFRCNGFHIVFQNEPDALAFKMRWC
jgi:hypothetical protein